jgi:hypothetical protein
MDVPVLLISVVSRQWRHAAMARTAGLAYHILVRARCETLLFFFFRRSDIWTDARFRTPTQPVLSRMRTRLCRCARMS